MEYLNWMAEHWLLTIMLASQAGITAIGVAHGIGPKGVSNTQNHNYPKGPQ